MLDEKKVLKNLQRKIVDFIWKTTPQNVVRIAVLVGIKVPKTLYKYLSSPEEKSSGDENT
jgi:hypothetical protein